MLGLYNVAIALYLLLVRIAALRSQKASDWLEGRRHWQNHLAAALQKGRPTIWVHCASAGEFEQGKPLIESLKDAYPQHQVLVSFFSPSGFEVGHNYPFADAVTYLPIDTRANARRFLDLVQPELAIFVKYDFWYHYFRTLADRHVPLLLASAVFRPQQPFFKPWGRFLRQMLLLPRHIFVQDEASLQLLQQQGLSHVSLSGDTRFDRVSNIAARWTELDGIAAFAAGAPRLVAGSTWPDDEKLLAAAGVDKMILAPHHIDESHLRQIEQAFPDSIRYSAYQRERKNKPVLIIDNVGMLSRLYRYADVAYVGGGFTRDGIHNILEAAVWGKPVVFGPNYQKYREAKELLAAGGAHTVASAEELRQWLQTATPERLAEMGKKASAYVLANTGATEKIMALIQEKRLLTRS